MRATFGVLAGAMFAAGAVAQAQSNAQAPATPSSSAQAATTAATLPNGTTVNAQLNSSVDSKKAKAGDKVEAHTTEAIKYDGKTILRQGAKLEGHVIEATARSKGDGGSTLAIQFDRAIPRKGEEIPLNVAILAIAAPQSEFSGGSPGPVSDPMSGAGAAADRVLHRRFLNTPVGTEMPERAGRSRRVGGRLVVLAIKCSDAPVRI